MKKWLIALILLLFTSNAFAANKYWVGGTGNLDGSDTTHISDTSGGAGGATYPAAGDTLIFDAASGGGTVTFTAGVTLAAITGGAHTGTIDFNGQTVTISGSLTLGGSGTRTVNLGASNITCGTWNMSTVTNLTFNAGTSTITHTIGATFAGGGLTYNDVILSDTVNAPVLSGTNTFANFTRTGPANKVGYLYLAANQIVTGTFTANGNSSVNRLMIQSSIRGTQRTITAATVTITNADFQDIVGAGAGSWDLSAVSGLSGDCGGNSGITFTTPVTNYWIGSTGNWDAVAEWASSSGGASSSGRVPLCQDAAVIDANSGTGTITQNMTRIGSVNFTGSSGITWTTSTVASFFGSINLTNLSTLTANSQTYTYEGRGSSTLDGSGKTWYKAFTIDAVSGTLTFSSAHLTNNVVAITLTSGTLSDGGYNVTIGNFISTGTATRALVFGSGNTWTVTYDVATVWNTAATGLSITPGTATIKITNTANTIFAGSGLTYPNIWNATSGVSVLTITGSNTFANFRIDAGRSTLFTAGTTTTVSSFTATGGSGTEITIGSVTAASHTLTKTGGGTITCDWCIISRSTATPATTWYATNSTDNANNSGWTFGAPPSGTTIIIISEDEQRYE